ncbi:MAG: MerR family transcriptional regulator [Crocinitomicaceae bacterium]|nr:MerR family transcriptional regulator [Crocinitomicaceae bacterium]
MAKYSIKDLENFTKIKAHTLRIWEQRYNLLSPERTDTNIRYYSDRDLKKILNINLLYKNGLKISKIAELSEKEIFDKASELLLSDTISTTDEVNRFVELVIELDDYGLHQLLNKLSVNLGVEKLFTDVLIPLLEKIGTLWQVDAISVSHEHFLSNVLREFLIVQIDKIPISRKSRGKVVLFLRENEKHELSLLFYYFVLKSRAFDCFYLGQSVPMKDLKTFVTEIKPEYLFTSMINEMTDDEVTQFFEQLASFFDLKNLFVGGYQLSQHPANIPADVHQIQDIKDIHIH